MNQRNVTHYQDIRRLALQMLYQFDARQGEDAESIRTSLQNAAADPTHHFDGPWKVVTLEDSADHERAFEKASAAWEHRDEADALATQLSPDWPTSRQPAMDRNVIRLCWYEMTEGGVPPKAAVNEAIELAKQFGTDRSAPFLNGVLDRMLKVVLKRLAGEEVDVNAIADEPAIGREDGGCDSDERRSARTVRDGQKQQTEFWSSE